MKESRKETISLHSVFFWLCVFLATASTVVHNQWADDYSTVKPFPLNETKELYTETHVYYAMQHVGRIFLLLAIWISHKSNRKTLLIFTLAEVVTLIDYLVTCNRDFLFKGFDTNTVKLIVYGVYIGDILIRKKNLNNETKDS